MVYKTIDLCAGIGGIRKGFELTKRFVNVASAEIDETACLTYEHLFGENPYNDITAEAYKASIESTQYDVLLAGFPCQAFSAVGLQKGFEDKTKGTLFFDIAQIIKRTKPKAVFLENVENLTSHDRGNTFHVIIETLEKELNYHVLGVTRGADGTLVYRPRDFIRNSRNFGVPQNRPRVYIIALSRDYFGNHLSAIPQTIPTGSNKMLYESALEVLDTEVPERFFLSSGYLDTLEKHCQRQQRKGNGFGYRIINAPGIDRPIAHTLLATGGSGRERNLVIDEKNGKKYAGMTVKGKYSPVNNKCIRTMTPNEWGRLQGFINYAFIDEAGIDRFSFPDGIPNVQKFKQFGNSVTIPVIETMASFLVDCMESMESTFTERERQLYNLYGNVFSVCRKIASTENLNMRESSLLRLFSLVKNMGCSSFFGVTDVAKLFGVTTARASQLVSKLYQCGLLEKNQQRKYRFIV